MFENELITQGLMIAGMGMGVVILFLCILIFAMLVMAKVVAYVNKICPIAVAQATSAQKSTNNDESVIAAVIAAAKRFG